MMTAALDSYNHRSRHFLHATLMFLITLVSFFSHNTMITVEIFHVFLFIQEILEYEERICAFNL